MTGPEQYVLVGVGRARERWSADLARWSTSGAAPIEFVQCLSADEARMVLASGRRVSALLVDARGAGVDRDLIDAAADAAAPTIVVSDGSIHRDWDALGCAAAVAPPASPRVLLEVLELHARPVDRSRRPGRSRLTAEPDTRGSLLAVIGSGGSGCSTLAMALSQVLGAVDPDHGPVVLVDGARRGDLAMYHHLGDVVPGLPELVEAHRSDRLDPDEIRRLAFTVPRRGYSVLLGRRRPVDWVTLRRRSVDATLDALTRAYDFVVVDTDRDLESQADTGSPDVEDRHAISLSALERADLVLVAGRPDLHGLHAMVHLIDDVLDTGVPPHRVVPVVVGAPRSPAARAQLSGAVAGLAGGGRTQQEPLHPVLHLARVRHLDDRHDRVAPLPTSVTRPLERLVPRLLTDVGRRGASAHTPPPVRPGELGTDAERPLGLSSDVA